MCKLNKKKKISIQQLQRMHNDEIFLIGFLTGAKVSRGVHLRSASVDDKLFGCSFVLTGVSGLEKQLQVG